MPRLNVKSEERARREAEWGAQPRSGPGGARPGAGRPRGSTPPLVIARRRAQEAVGLALRAAAAARAAVAAIELVEAAEREAAACHAEAAAALDALAQHGVVTT